ncbi:MAG TPA: hypothetical protein VN841_02465 [Bryobacteraceae bacterium]|nr:hypothetical protein [Bryobacteraceae bacterium]
MKSFVWIATLSLVPWLSAQAPAPAQAPVQAPVQAVDPPGVTAPWDVSQTIVALAEQTSRLKPLLDQVTPREWLNKGAPQAYVEQWQSAQRELADVQRVAQSLQKQPDRLTLALDTYFRVQSLETRLNSLVEGIRRYQNPAVGDLVVGVIGESAANRDKLRDYISDLANQKEQEFTVVDREAQRCRTNLNRQPATQPSTRPAPAKAPAAPKPAATKQP